MSMKFMKIDCLLLRCMVLKTFLSIFFIYRCLYSLASWFLNTSKMSTVTYNKRYHKERYIVFIKCVGTPDCLLSVLFKCVGTPDCLLSVLFKCVGTPDCLLSGFFKICWDT